MYEHLVLLKVKDSFTAEQREETVKKALAFKEEVPGILGISAGVIETENPQHKQGFALALRLTFEDKQACLHYDAHPAHQAFLKEVGPYIEEIIIADYPF
ncbi:stress protein [Paenibacillus yonginensis]|uniref:Stress protein n=1 Tax=Paenibacillus yonginensis TaxID=1462996 RepID=A0A1B1MVZ6_9BACL|nr:Dabb family protein [Paenibacillus yonginensis]ANS73346.1 stress protein [Paenibacillus yonginensis]